MNCIINIQASPMAFLIELVIRIRGYVMDANITIVNIMMDGFHALFIHSG
jgi:hypothetical protein